MQHGIYKNGLKKVLITLSTGEIFTVTNGPGPIADNLADVIAAIIGEKKDLPIDAQEIYRRAKGFIAQCGEERFSYVRPAREC